MATARGGAGGGGKSRNDLPIQIGNRDPPLPGSDDKDKHFICHWTGRPIRRKLRIITQQGHQAKNIVIKRHTQLWHLLQLIRTEPSDWLQRCQLHGVRVA
jgi:hypothetical protein